MNLFGMILLAIFALFVILPASAFVFFYMAGAGWKSACTCAKTGPSGSDGSEASRPSALTSPQSPISGDDQLAAIIPE